MKVEPKIAYFSAEIGINENIKTYSGGLGVLAGDTIKAMADFSVPFCGITLLYNKGFFKQVIDESNRQKEEEDPWDYKKYLEDTGVEVDIKIAGEVVKIHVWRHMYESPVGGVVPIYYLDTNVDENPDWAKEITDHLYMGNRLYQELVLGFGGYDALKELGHDIETYHMNEGHSAFLTLKLYRELGEKKGYNDEQVQERCVFTTHTPIAAGHDVFEYFEFEHAMKGQEEYIPWHIKKLAGEYKLNMTKLALSLSGYSNAVSLKHRETTKEMFPNTTINSITNGIHVDTWICDDMRRLFSRYIPDWKKDYSKLQDVFKIPNTEIYKAHQKAKKRLIEYVNKNSVVDAQLDESVLTIGFARRFIEYKDAEMIFSNIDALKGLGGKVQFIFAGKSHKNDTLGKDIMRRVIQKAHLLKHEVSIAFLADYDMEKAKMLVSGCDLWLNTPIPPNEASGTSGMKAAVNGVPHFSRLDGWAIEGFKRNGGGFPLYEYTDLINQLEYKIIPMFYDKNKSAWIDEMKLSIGNSGSYFTTHRMAKEYLDKAYGWKK